MPFTVIGELLNTTRPAVRDAVRARDEGYVRQQAIAQQDAGADYLDLNAGAGVRTETADLLWLVDTIQPVVSVPLCIDSPDTKVLEAAFGRLERPPMVNSITLEKKRYERMRDLLRGKPCQVVALCMDDTGMPSSVDDICRRADALATGLVAVGFDPATIWIDPLVGPVSTRTENGMLAMEAVAGIKKNIPGVKTVCGLSNISFGLPARRVINRFFLPLMMNHGLDGALLDPLDPHLLAARKTTELLLGNDAYCLGFMDSVAEGRMGV
jgi:cobalamin-dependent methionine synthase I